MTRVLSTLATLFAGACQWWAGLVVLILVGWGDDATPSLRTEERP